MRRKTTQHLELDFKHVMKRIILFWGHPEFREYMRQLLLDDRGNRSGFPPSVMDELFFLVRIHDEAYPPKLKIEACVWGPNMKRR